MDVGLVVYPADDAVVALYQFRVSTTTYFTPESGRRLRQVSDVSDLGTWRIVLQEWTNIHGDTARAVEISIVVKLRSGCRPVRSKMAQAWLTKLAWKQVTSTSMAAPSEVAYDDSQTDHLSISSNPPNNVTSTNITM
jgi:hypothetical protein